MKSKFSMFLFQQYVQPCTMDGDLDDTHLCIKCNATIVGIDAYVQHRRRNCIGKADQISGQLVSSEHHTAFTAFEYADDEANAKSHTAKPYTLPYGVNEPSSTKTNAPGAHSIPTSIVLHDPSRVENYDCELGADIFFSSLELQSSSKGRPSVLSAPPRTSANPSRTRKTTASSSHDVDPDDWTDDSHPVADGSALMKAVRDISGSRKTDSVFQMIRLSQDSPFSFGDDDDDDDDEPAAEDENRSDDEHVPPPSYTKGKWVPGTKIVRLDYKTEHSTGHASNDRFRCRVCDRSLCNEAAYAKHLKSELHMKRSLPENELELACRPVDKTTESKLQLDRPAPGVVVSKQSSSESSSATNVLRTQKTRVRRHIFIKCEICQSRLSKHLHGKHLISQFHYRRMCKLNRPYDHLLAYMPIIVQQCPFQCHACRFYANTEAQFLRHWKSAEHQETSEASANGPFWCSFCKFQCSSNTDMGTHLASDEHQELLRSLDRSVPVVIRKMSSIACPSCQATFQLNVQLRAHGRVCLPAKSTSDLHPSAVTSASDEYQSKFRCERCPVVLRTRKAFQMHTVSVHGVKTYFCSICRLDFVSAKKARAHRTSAEHRVKSAHLRKHTNLARSCRVCGTTLADVVELRQHLREEHPTEKHR